MVSVCWSKDSLRVVRRQIGQAVQQGRLQPFASG